MRLYLMANAAKMRFPSGILLNMKSHADTLLKVAKLFPGSLEFVNSND